MHAEVAKDTSTPISCNLQQTTADSEIDEDMPPLIEESDDEDTFAKQIRKPIVLQRSGPFVPAQCAASSSIPPAAQAVAASTEAVTTLELCAGSAGVTRALSDIGFLAHGVDHKRNRHRPKAACAKIDLATTEGQRILLDFINVAVVFMTWMGPPCGTASRAREIPLTRKQIQQGAPVPVPLRSAYHPRGFPWLKGLDKEKVLLASCIYDFFSDHIDNCMSRGLYFAIENPRGSWLWSLPRYVLLLKQAGIYIVDFQACCHGGDRPKWTRIITNCPELQGLAAVCPGISANHSHEDWGVERSASGKWEFRTAAEAEYSAGLCQLVARLTAQAAYRCGHLQFQGLLQKPISDAPASKKQRIGAAIQPRGQKVPQIVPEYLNIEAIEVTCAVYATLTVGKSLPPELSLRQNRILRLENGDARSKSDFTAVVGFYRTPKEFTDEAVKADHPFDTICDVPDVLRNNVFFILTHGKVAVSRYRMLQVQRLRKLVHDNSDRDKTMLEGLDPAVRHVLRDKKLATLGDLLTEFNYADKSMTGDIAKGFAHTGIPPRSHIFKPDVQLPSISTDELKASSKWVRSATIASIKSSGNKQIDNDVWLETLQERDKGWLQGEFTVAEIDGLFPEGWCAARRFGLDQNGKLRCIDDLTEPGTNSAFGSSEKLHLMNLDAVAALVRYVSACVSDDRTIKVTLSDGTVLTGKLHPEWSLEEARSWLGRCLDLRKAYRQLVADPQSRWAAVVCVYNPIRDCCSCFVAISMLFGGTAAVYGFNRAARSVWFALANLLKICWTNYYDDYPTIEPAATASISKMATECCLRLLGWDFADEGKKCLPFHTSFVSLGAVLDLSLMVDGQAFLTNKADRIASIAEEIVSLRESKVMTAGQAASIKGKLQYAESQCYGRIASRCMRLVGEVATGKRKGSPLDKTTLDALQWLLDRLASATPRPLIPDRNLRSVVLFTDSASETNLHTCGAVLIDVHSGTFQYFGLEIRTALIDEWRTGGIEQIITHAELFPVWLSKHVWGALLRGRRVLTFVDNNAAKDSLIRGYMDSLTGDPLLQSVLILEFEQASLNWYARVPSKSNIADDPSRLDFKALMDDKRFSRVYPDQPRSFLTGQGVFDSIDSGGS